MHGADSPIESNLGFLSQDTRPAGFEQPTIISVDNPFDLLSHNRTRNSCL